MKSRAQVMDYQPLIKRWREGELTIAQEHFASNLIRRRLDGLASVWGKGWGPLALLACPPGERHERAGPSPGE